MTRVGHSHDRPLWHGSLERLHQRLDLHIDGNGENALRRTLNTFKRLFAFLYCSGTNFLSRLAPFPFLGEGFGRHIGDVPFAVL